MRRTLSVLLKSLEVSPLGKKFVNQLGVITHCVDILSLWNMASPSTSNENGCSCFMGFCALCKSTHFHGQSVYAILAF